MLPNFLTQAGHQSSGIFSYGEQPSNKSTHNQQKKPMICSKPADFRQLLQLTCVLMPVGNSQRPLQLEYWTLGSEVSMYVYLYTGRLFLWQPYKTYIIVVASTQQYLGHITPPPWLGTDNPSLSTESKVVSMCMHVHVCMALQWFSIPYIPTYQWLSAHPTGTWPKSTNRLSHFTRFRSDFGQRFLCSTVNSVKILRKVTKWMKRGCERGYLTLFAALNGYLVKLWIKSYKCKRKLNSSGKQMI